MAERECSVIPYMVDPNTGGDDVDMFVETQEIAERHNEKLNEFGFKINKRKSRITKNGGEFLKYEYNSHGIRGITLRALRSILWSTEDEAKLIGDEVRMARIGIWSTIMSRVMYDEKFECSETEMLDLVKNDMFRAFNRRFSYSKIENWLRTSSCFGGAGLFNPTTDMFEKNRFTIGKFESTISKRGYYTMQLIGDKLKSSNKYYNPELATIATGAKYNTVRFDLTNYDIPYENDKLKEIINIYSQPFNTLDILLTPENELIPSNTPPIVTANMDYTKYTLEKPSLDDVIEEARNDDYGKLGFELRGRKTRLSYGFSQFIYRNRHNLSKGVLSEILAGNISTNLPTPTNLIVKLGEVLAPVAWHVVALKFLLSSLFYLKDLKLFQLLCALYSQVIPVQFNNVINYYELGTTNIDTRE
jgi:hypothetical protein